MVPFRQGTTLATNLTLPAGHAGPLGGAVRLILTAQDGSGFVSEAVTRLVPVSWPGTAAGLAAALGAAQQTAAQAANAGDAPSALATVAALGGLLNAAAAGAFVGTALKDDTSPLDRDSGPAARAQQREALLAVVRSAASVSVARQGDTWQQVSDTVGVVVNQTSEVSLLAQAGALQVLNTTGRLSQSSSNSSVRSLVSALSLIAQASIATGGGNTVPFATILAGGAVPPPPPAAGAGGDGSTATPPLAVEPFNPANAPPASGGSSSSPASSGGSATGGVGPIISALPPLGVPLPPLGGVPLPLRRPSPPPGAPSSVQQPLVLPIVGGGRRSLSALPPPPPPPSPHPPPSPPIPPLVLSVLVTILENVTNSLRQEFSVPGEAPAVISSPTINAVVQLDSALSAGSRLFTSNITAPGARSAFSPLPAGTFASALAPGEAVATVFMDLNFTHHPCVNHLRPLLSTTLRWLLSSLLQWLDRTRPPALRC